MTYRCRGIVVMRSPKSQTNVIENKLTRQLHDALAYFQLHSSEFSVTDHK